MHGLLKENVKISSRKLMAVTILPAGTLAWVFFSYYIFEDIFKSITTDLFWVYTAKALFFSFGAFSAIAGSMIGKRINFKECFPSKKELPKRRNFPSSLPGNFAILSNTMGFQATNQRFIWMLVREELPAI